MRFGCMLFVRMQEKISERKLPKIVKINRYKFNDYKALVKREGLDLGSIM
jgi:hypothetical protein